LPKQVKSLPADRRENCKEKEMTLEDLRNICLQLDDVTEDIKWGHDICFSIGGKMFLVTSADSTPTGASFKVPDYDFDMLTEREGFMPAPYVARYKWVYVKDIRLINKKEWEQFAKKSYQLVKAKLPKKKK
jgi:predicted DNA-binding protein (MmcQ/YjbR family)